MDMDNLHDLQVELMQVRNRMELDEQYGLGWSCDDVHTAGELMARIAKIRLVSEGAE